MIKLIPSRYIRTGLGLIAGIVVTLLIWIALDRLTFSPLQTGAQSTDLRVYFAIAVFAVIFGIPSGILVHALLWFANLRGLLHYICAGFFAGAALKCLTGLHFDKYLLMFGLWAAGIAAIAWLIRRPDKDSKQDTPPPSVSA